MASRKGNNRTAHQEIISFVEFELSVKITYKGFS